VNRNVIGFLVLVVVGTAALLGVYYAMPYLTSVTQKDTSDAGAVGTTLRIGVDNWVGYVPLCSKELRRQMRVAGYLVQCEDDNADTPARMKRLREGNLEFAVATVDSLLLNGVREKFPGTIVLVIDESSGGDAIVARAAKIASLQELKSRSDFKIAFTPGSPSEHLLKSVAVHFDVPALRERNGAWRVPVRGSSDALKQLQSGKVDIAVLWEPDVSRALAIKGVHKLLGTDQTKRLIVDVLLVSREFSRTNGPAVRQLLESYFRTLKHFRDNPAALADEVKQAARVDEAQVTAILGGVRWATLEENAREWFGLAAPGGNSSEGLIDVLESTARILVDSGDMRENPIPERDPYRLQHRLYVEDLFKTGIGATAEAPGATKQAGGRKFAALTAAQWEALREIGTLKARPITFQSGASELSVEGRTELDAAAQNLRHYPNFRIVIRGHTGTRGELESNRQLSLERADTIKRHLMITHGIDEVRLRAVGYGGERPLSRLEGESDRAYEYRLPRVELHMVTEGF